jgi:cytochrome c553
MRSPGLPFSLFAVATMGLAGTFAAAFALAAEGNGATGTPQARVLDLRRQQPITGDAQAGQALSAVCSACHGTNGVGIAPNFPNLAGQSATYLYVQLRTFKDGERSDPVMGAMVASIGDIDMRNLAAYYASLPANAATQGASASRGAKLFTDGDPSVGIPPCQACHGDGGRGPRPDADVDATAPRPPWSTVPRLQGQSGAYVAKALHDFRDGARGGTSNAAIMHGVAQTLGDADIQALADFFDAR